MGIFKKSQASTKEYEKSSVTEEFKTILSGYEIEKENESNINLKDYLEAEKNVKQVIDNNNDTYTVIYKEFSFTINVSTLKIIEIGNVEDVKKYVQIKVGDYVNYNPKTDFTSYNLEIKYSGSESDAIINRDDSMKWKILNINDDGTYDLISDSITSEKIRLVGAKAYNNGVYLMNDVCNKLYGNTDLNINAKNVSMKEIEKSLTPDGRKLITDTNYGTAAYNHSVTCRDSSYPNLYAKENGSDINTTTVKTDGIGNSDDAQLDASNSTYVTLGDNSLTVTETYFNFIVAQLCNPDVVNLYKASGEYWISSRCNNVNLNYADFSLRYMTSSGGISAGAMFRSYIKENASSKSLRPVVKLGANVTITPCIGENSITNMHEIKAK